MPHKCLNCNSVYENTSEVIMKGCPKCGKKLFLFIKKIPENIAEIELTNEQKELVLNELNGFVDLDEPDMPIVLKLENIRVIEPGKYEIDINQLMKKDKPLIYKVQDGSYLIDLNFLRNVNKK